jgi:hypothetical protein
MGFGRTPAIGYEANKTLQGAGNFLELTDTPSDYTGQAGKGLIVNVGETALEFTTIEIEDIWSRTGTTVTLENAGDTVDLETGKMLIGADANFTDYPNAQAVVSQGDTGDNTASWEIGCAFEAVGSPAAGVRTVGMTNGGGASYGIHARGKVSDPTDAGSAIGLYGASTDAHTGGINVGIFGGASASTVENRGMSFQVSGVATNNYGVYVSASGGTNNYSFYGLNGTLWNVGESILGNNVTIGSGTAATDYTLTFNGETNDGIITWMEDENAYYLQGNLGIETPVTQATINGMAIDGRLVAVVDSSATTVAAAFAEHGDTAIKGCVLYGARSRSTAASPTIVQDGDNLFDIIAIGYDGTDYAQSSRIDLEVDGTPGSDDMPGRICFKTSPDGSQTPAEAVRISADKTLTTYGGIKRNITTVNAATYDLLVTDDILNVTYTGTAAVTSLTLPAAQVVAGRTIVIKDAGGKSATNNITIDTEGAEKIDGADTLVLNDDYEAVSIYSDGSNWFVI